MDKLTKIKKLQALKEAYLATQARLEKARKLEEAASATHLSTLLESELERAQLILAAKDLMEKIQKMAEDVAKMQADAMPLADNMKGAFGPENAQAFEGAVTQALQDALAALRASKDTINTGILKVEGKISDEDQLSNDMAMGGDAPAADPLAGGDDVAADPLAGDDELAADPFGGAAAAAGPADEPLGRVKKESREAAGKMSLKESGRRLLARESLESLVDWLLSEAATQMQPAQFTDFAKKVAVKASQDGEKLAGWIGQKKYGSGLAAQLSNPLEDTTSSEAIEEGKSYRRGDDEDADSKKKASKQDRADRKGKRQVEESVEESTAQKLARAVAEAIDANIAENGRGRAAEVMENFAKAYEAEAGLNEGEGAQAAQFVAKAFESMFGTTPAHYSMKKMRDARVAEAAPMSPEQQKQAAVTSKLGAAMATDKNTAKKPIQSVMGQLDGAERSTAQKMVSDLKKQGKDPKTVADLMGNDVAESVGTQTMNKGTAMSTDAGKHKANTNRPSQTSNQSAKPLKPTAKAKNVLAKGTVSEGEVVENINAAILPVDPKSGQYKGEPFQTDAGKHKANQNRMGSTKSDAADTTNGGPLKPSSTPADMQGKGPAKGDPRMGKKPGSEPKQEPTGDTSDTSGTPAEGGESEKKPFEKKDAE